MCEKTKEMVEHSDYREAEVVSRQFGWGFIKNLETKCNLDTKALETRFGNALGDMKDAEVAHQEQSFSTNPLSMMAEVQYSKLATANLDGAIAELENAVREKARELKCEL